MGLSWDALGEPYLQGLEFAMNKGFVLLQPSAISLQTSFLRHDFMRCLHFVAKSGDCRNKSMKKSSVFLLPHEKHPNFAMSKEQSDVYRDKD